MRISKSKIVSSLMIILSLCVMSMSFAMTIPDVQPTQPEINSIQPTVQRVLGAIQVVGVIVAIGMVMYAGIKYLTSGAGEKAKAKEQLVPIAIGAVLVAAAPTIVNWLFGIAG